MTETGCIIIEDEPLAAKVLSRFIAQVPFLRLDSVFKDAMSAEAWLKHHSTGLIFLDIHLPRIKGMDFLKSLENPPSVIVTTAYEQYAVEGFNMNVVDYLLKPFDFKRFMAAVNKIRALQETGGTSEKESLVISIQKKKVRILFSDILYIESQREYVKIVTRNQAFHSKMSTHEIEDLLPSSRFARIHRSFIVSIEKIGSFTAETVTINGVDIPMGKSYKNVINRFF